MTSEGRCFTDIELEHGDWIVDPGLLDYENLPISAVITKTVMMSTMISTCAPGGTYWDDVTEEDLPAFYNDWYLPLIEAGEPMPDSIG